MVTELTAEETEDIAVQVDKGLRATAKQRIQALDDLRSLALSGYKRSPEEYLPNLEAANNYRGV